MSGILNLENKVNYDHIVPLDKYGFNDISNIQLLCFDCNQKKKANPAITSHFYQSWYSYENNNYTREKSNKL
ncbi:HNH endonuclease [Aliarcobacter butzleri]|uniref:HNH endonuclease n=1 Tax=Aliarcobacter butzleri TaxID=28197 RepID=UPI003AF8DC29